MTRRQRLTWRRRQASPPPATPGYGTSEHDHPADQPDSGPHDYENGDTSSWAEDPYPPPYPQGMPPATPGYGTEDGDHPAEKRGSLKQLVLQRAAKAYRIASAMLGPQASTNQIDDRALDLMDLNDFVFNATYQRVARGAKVGGDFLGCDETMSFQDEGGIDEEEEMLAQMLDEEDDVLGFDDGDLDEDDVLGMDDDLLGMDDEDDVLGMDDEDDALGMDDEDDALGMDDDLLGMDDDLLGMDDDLLGMDDDLLGMDDEDDLLGMDDEDDLLGMDDDLLGMDDDLLGMDDEDDLLGMDDEDDVLGMDDEDDLLGMDDDLLGMDDDLLGMDDDLDDDGGLYAGLDSEEMAMLDDLEAGEPDLDDSDIDSEMASLYSSDDPNVEEAPSTESSDTAAVFSMNGDPMGLSGTPTLSDEEDSILSEIFGGKTADDDSEEDSEEEDSEEVEEEEDSEEVEEEEDSEEVEEEDSKESKKKASRTASQRPRRRKPGRGPKTLGSVSRTDSTGKSEVDELSKLWPTSPSLDGIF